MNKVVVLSSVFTLSSVFWAAAASAGVEPKTHCPFEAAAAAAVAGPVDWYELYAPGEQAFLYGPHPVSTAAAPAVAATLDPYELYAPGEQAFLYGTHSDSAASSLPHSVAAGPVDWYELYAPGEHAFLYPEAKPATAAVALAQADEPARGSSSPLSHGGHVRC